MALTYAAMNMATFPLRPGQKEPATAHGFKDASVDYDQIKCWWNQNPDFNVGARPWPDIAVVDVDVAGAKTGNQSFDNLVDELGPLPATWVAETATGGRHIWLRLSDDVIAARGVHKTIAPYIDIKVGGTGYLAMPPSRTVNGTYRWLDPGRDGLPAGLPAEAPEPWRERILKPVRRQHVGSPQPPAASGENPVYVAVAVAEELARLAEAKPGGKSGTGVDDTLLSVGTKLFSYAKGGHVDRQAAEDEMKRIAMQLGHSDHYAEKTLNQAWSYAEPKHPPERRSVAPAYTLDPQDQP
ncbi:hypothetical protein AWC00_26645 [Mycobacterium conspicuum]|nr:hypothetical protein AWC00_26645 [Mycobacterium conspicuum]